METASHPALGEAPGAFAALPVSHVVAPAVPWIDALPVASALCAMSGDWPEIVKSNAAFDRLAISFAKSSHFDMAILGREIAMLAAGNQTNGAFGWYSRDRVRKRLLDVTIARYGVDERYGPLFLLVCVDRTAEVETQANLRREMLGDSLTGLPNRTGFEEAVEERIETHRKRQAGARDRSFAIFSVDLARFSQVNECAGSIAGDELILAVASRLTGIIRKHDIVGRISGNEFAIFAALNKIERDIERIRARIESIFLQPYRLSDLEIQVDAAISVAVGDIDHGDPSDTIRYAQIALKQAKASRQFKRYTPEVLDKARYRFSIETDLRRALQRDELDLHFQPLVDLNTGRVNGFEALARWHHADRGHVSPSDFIPVAEECGLIVPLGRWALARAASTLAEWDRLAGRKLPIKFNVNLSAEQFARDDIACIVEDAIRTSGLEGHRLTLELTESAILSDPRRAGKVMEALKALNTNLAMDDFGTGYSNLAFLQMLPIDILKIDRSFVTEMLENRDKVAIVRAVLSLASALGMTTTAEGVETAELSHTLAALGCGQGQGYYYAKALAADDALAYYQRNLAGG